MSRNIAANTDPHAGDQLPPIHPGEVLLEDFMKPLGLKSPTAAKAMGVPRTRVERLVAGIAPVTPDTALRLSRAFGSSAQFWLNLQNQYDLQIAAAAAGSSLDRIERLSAKPQRQLVHSR